MTVKKFFAGLLMVIGGLMAILTGGCTILCGIILDPLLLMCAIPIVIASFLIGRGLFLIGKNWREKAQVADGLTPILTGGCILIIVWAIMEYTMGAHIAGLGFILSPFLISLGLFFIGKNWQEKIIVDEESW